MFDIACALLYENVMLKIRYYTVKRNVRHVWNKLKILYIEGSLHEPELSFNHERPVRALVKD